MEPIMWGSTMSWALTSLGGAFVGSYVGAYMKKKGEERAIREGFKEVLKQTGETTKVTKGIENRLSNETWSLQKRWELKREALFEVIKQSFTVRVMFEELPPVGFRSEEQVRNIKTGVDRLFQHIAIAEIVCEIEGIAALREFQSHVRLMLTGVLVKQDAEEPLVSLTTLLILLKKWEKVSDAIRKELEIDKAKATPQSTESSAAPTPD